MKALKYIALGCAVIMACMIFTGCNSNKSYTVLEEDFGGEEYGIGFRINDIAFGLEIQKHLDDMIADGTAAKISDDWFGKDTLIKNADFKKESTAPEGDDSLQKIKDKGYFILGLDASFPPMGFIDEGGNIAGYDIDLAKEVAKRMGVELKLQAIDWNTKELELTSGKIDCIWNGMTINDDRLAAMFFTKPYLNNKQIIIVAEGSGIKTKADLKGKIIGLQKGSSAYDAVMKDSASDDIEELIQFKDNQKVYTDLKTGRIDAMVVDEVVGRYLLEKEK